MRSRPYRVPTVKLSSDRRIEEVGVVPEKAMKGDAKSHTAG